MAPKANKKRVSVVEKGGLATPGAEITESNQPLKGNLKKSPPDQQSYQSGGPESIRPKFSTVPIDEQSGQIQKNKNKKYSIIKRSRNRKISVITPAQETLDVDSNETENDSENDRLKGIVSTKSMDVLSTYTTSKKSKKNKRRNRNKSRSFAEDENVSMMSGQTTDSARSDKKNQLPDDGNSLMYRPVVDIKTEYYMNNLLAFEAFINHMPVDVDDLSSVFELRRYHSEPCFQKDINERMRSRSGEISGALMPNVHLPKKKQVQYNVIKRCLSMEDIMLSQTSYPELMTGMTLDAVSGKYEISDEMMVEWKGLFDTKNERFSFFDELMVAGRIVDSMEIPGPDDDVEKLYEADQRDFRSPHIDYARLVFKTKHVYTGNLENWYFEGEGRYSWIDGTTYQGHFKYGVMHGNGIILWTDGSVYQGEFINGIRDGYGIYSTAEGYTYAGEWFQGAPHGMGRMWYDPNIDDSDFYDGQWKECKPHGFGTRQYSNGDRYVGNFENGVRFGKGTMTWLKERQIFKGDWLNGVPHGSGTHTWYLPRTSMSDYPTRHVYRGEWKNGMRHGVGRNIYACGSVYEGHWENGQRHGKGIFVNPAGEVLFGLFRFGSIVGGADVPLHAPTYACKFGNLIKKLKKYVRIQPGTEELQELGLFEVVIRYLPQLRLLFKRAGYLGEWWGNQGHFPKWMKKLNPPHKPKEVVYDSHLKHCNILDEVELHDVHVHGHKPHRGSPDNVHPLTRFGLWLFLKDCPGILNDFTLADFDNAWNEVSSISFQTKHNPFEPVYLHQFLQCLITIAAIIYVKVPKLKEPRNRKDSPPSKYDKSLISGSTADSEHLIKSSRISAQFGEYEIEEFEAEEDGEGYEYEEEVEIEAEEVKEVVPTAQSKASLKPKEYIPIWKRKGPAKEVKPVDKSELTEKPTTIVLKKSKTNAVGKKPVPLKAKKLPDGKDKKSSLPELEITNLEKKLSVESAGGEEEGEFVQENFLEEGGEDANIRKESLNENEEVDSKTLEDSHETEIIGKNADHGKGKKFRKGSVVSEYRKSKKKDKIRKSTTKILNEQSIAEHESKVQIVDNIIGVELIPEEINETGKEETESAEQKAPEGEALTKARFTEPELPEVTPEKLKVSGKGKKYKDTKNRKSKAKLKSGKSVAAGLKAGKSNSEKKITKEGAGVEEEVGELEMEETGEIDLEHQEDEAETAVTEETKRLSVEETIGEALLEAEEDVEEEGEVLDIPSRRKGSSSSKITKEKENHHSNLKKVRKHSVADQPMLPISAVAGGKNKRTNSATATAAGGKNKKLHRTGPGTITKKSRNSIASLEGRKSKPDLLGSGVQGEDDNRSHSIHLRSRSKIFSSEEDIGIEAHGEDDEEMEEIGEMHSEEEGERSKTQSSDEQRRGERKKKTSNAGSHGGTGSNFEGCSNTNKNSRKCNQTKRKANEIKFSEIFERLLTEILIPSLNTPPGQNLPDIPDPLPPLADLYYSFSKANGNKETITGLNFTRSVLPHLVFPNWNDCIFWTRSKDVKCPLLNLEFIFNYFNQPPPVEYETSKLGEEFLGDKLANISIFTDELKDSAKSFAKRRSNSISVYGEGNTVFDETGEGYRGSGEMFDQLAGGDFNTDRKSLVSGSGNKSARGKEKSVDDDAIEETVEFPFSEKDLAPEPFLWEQTTKCIHVQKTETAFKNLRSEDVMNVLKFLYPQLIGKVSDTNMGFDMTFVDWLWAISLVAKTSSDRAFFASMKTESNIEHQHRRYHHPNHMSFQQNPYLANAATTFSHQNNLVSLREKYAKIDLQSPVDMNMYNAKASKSRSDVSTKSSKLNYRNPNSSPYTPRAGTVIESKENLNDSRRMKNE